MPISQILMKIKNANLSNFGENQTSKMQISQFLVKIKNANLSNFGENQT